MSLLPRSWSRRASRRQVNSSAPERASREDLPGIKADDLSPRAKKRWFEFFIAPVIESNRLFVIAVMMGGIALVEGLALYQLIPLHQRVPYLAEPDEEGKLREVASFKPLTVETAQQADIKFHLRRWARWIFTVDSQTKTNLENATPWVRGAAANQLTEWVEKRDRPGERQARDPDYTRTIEKKIAVTYGQGKTVFLHIELVEKHQGIEIGRQKKLLQIDYEQLPDQLSDDNPVGVAIINFTIGDE